MFWTNITDALGVGARLNRANGEVQFDCPVGAQTNRSLASLAESGVLLLDTSDNRNFGNIVTRIYRLINDEAVLAYQGLPADETERGLKFDVTVILPLAAVPEIAPEYPKTIGHLHTRLPGSRHASPDFYQVVHGQGALVLQEFDNDQVIAHIVEVKAGDAVLIPPWLAHISVNTGPEPLVFSNICVRRPHLDYESITQCRGGAFYVVSRLDGSGYDLVLNQAYKARGFAVSPPAIVEPNIRTLNTLGVSRGEPIYACLESSAPVLDSLINPDTYVDLFKQTLRARV